MILMNFETSHTNHEDICNAEVCECVCSEEAWCECTHELSCVMIVWPGLATKHSFAWKLGARAMA